MHSACSAAPINAARSHLEETLYRSSMQRIKAYPSLCQLPVFVPQHTLVGDALVLQSGFSSLCSSVHILQLHSTSIIQIPVLNTDATLSHIAPSVRIASPPQVGQSVLRVLH